MNIVAQTGGYANTNGSVDAAESVKLGAAPTGVSHNEYDLENYVNVNRGNTASKADLASKNSEISIKAKIENLHVIAKNFVEGSGVFGGVDAYCENQMQITTTIWADDAAFNGKNGTNLRSNLGEGYTAYFEELSEAALYGGGYERASSSLKGNFYSIIYTHDRNLVNGGSGFTHVASDTIRHHLDTKNTGWATSWGIKDDLTNYYHNAYCDFCKNDTTDKKYDYDWDIDAKLKAALQKALEAINDINRQVNGKKPVTKARYDEIDDQASGAIYVLDLEATLVHEETFGEDRLAKYRLWNNSMTNQDVYLLHNAANLFRGSRLNYVSDVLRGDLDDGTSYNIDIFTALNKYAYNHPVIPIGSSGSLDFSTGVFTLPELADFELYLYEVSGKWMTEQFDNGFIRRFDADQEGIDAFALGGIDSLPTDPKIVEGLIELGEGVHCSAELVTRYMMEDTYNIPVRIGGDRHVLRCMMDVMSREMSINGLWEGYDTDSSMFNRSVKSLSEVAGQEYTLLYPIDGSDGDGRIQYEAGVPMTMYRALEIKQEKLPAGTYYLDYWVEDMFTHQMYVGRAGVNWDGEKVSLLPGGEWEGTVTLAVPVE